MMYWNGHMTTGGWVISILWTVIIFALIAGAIAWLVSELSNRNPRRTDTTSVGSAREILDRRLAKGELTVEQYKELREAIGGEALSTSREPLPPRPASAAGGTG
jgi:putative membrane protein